MTELSTKKPKFSVDHWPISGGWWIRELCIAKPEAGGRWEYLDVGEKPTVLLCGLTAERKLVLASIFRFPVKEFCLELPGGVIEEGEDPRAAVLRELREETGYEPEGKVDFLCRGFLNNSKSTGRFEVWYGLNCRKVGKVKLDPMEKTAGLQVVEMGAVGIIDNILGGLSHIDPPLASAVLALQAKGLLW